MDDRNVSLELLGIPGVTRVFDGMWEGSIRLGLRTLRKTMHLPLLDTKGLDHDALQAIWDKEWSEHGKEYDEITDHLRAKDMAFIRDSRLKWAAPMINAVLELQLGSGYLAYQVSQVQKRNEIVNPPNGVKSLIISGGIGTGKTMAMAWRCQTLALEAAIEHDFDRIEDLLAVWPSGQLFNNLHKGLDVAENAAIMGIDDYGAEYVEPFALSQFELLIERRYARHLITIVTTNIPKEAFRTRKGFERIESRLLKRCNFVTFVGDDRRKALNGKETV